MERKGFKISAILGSIATAIGILGFLLCCNVLLVMFLGAGIALAIIQNSQLLLGIGIGMITASLIIFFFDKKTCRVEAIEELARGGRKNDE